MGEKMMEVQWVAAGDHKLKEAHVSNCLIVQLQDSMEWETNEHPMHTC